MIFVLACGRHKQPVHARQLSKKRQRLKYKQWNHKIREGVNDALNKMSLEHKITNFSDLMEIPLARFITLAANYFGYEETTKKLVVKWVHPVFLKSHTESSRENNPN